jgi:apolipoprotein N-acyltransferase
VFYVCVSLIGIWLASVVASFLTQSHGLVLITFGPMLGVVVVACIGAVASVPWRAPPQRPARGVWVVDPNGQRTAPGESRPARRVRR